MNEEENDYKDYDESELINLLQGGQSISVMICVDNEISRRKAEKIWDYDWNAD